MSVNGYLQLHLAKGIGPATMRRVLSRLSQMDTSLEEFLRLPSSEQVTRFGLAQRQAEALYTARSKTENVRAELEQRGIALISRDSSDYPDRLRWRLGEQAPSLLYTWGNQDLLQEVLIGFCGARNVSEKGIVVAQDCATQITNWGWVVVSGGARGVDTVIHRTALETGGATVIVLPEGILRYRLRREIKHLVSQEQALLISEFPPNMTWSVANAMQRNRTVCGLSKAVVVIESGTSGGTFEAGKLALRLKMPLFVVDYAKPSSSAAGNNYFLARGARPLRRGAESGYANLEPLRRIVQNCPKTNTAVVQERLL